MQRGAPATLTCVIAVAPARPCDAPFAVLTVSCSSRVADVPGPVRYGASNVSDAPTVLLSIVCVLLMYTSMPAMLRTSDCESGLIWLSAGVYGA